jgi:hypothetical protein
VQRVPFLLRPSPRGPHLSSVFPHRQHRVELDELAIARTRLAVWRYWLLLCCGAVIRFLVMSETSQILETRTQCEGTAAFSTECFLLSHDLSIVSCVVVSVRGWPWCVRGGVVLLVLRVG